MATGPDDVRRPQPARRDPLIRAAGGIAIANGVISAFGVVLLIDFYVSVFIRMGILTSLPFGWTQDISAAVQYLLTVPIAVALHRILRPYNPGRINAATAIGIGGMIAVFVLQMLLVFGALTFRQQVVWLSLSIAGVGSWMVITGSVARSTGRLPHSVRMSWVGATYFGYPVWAFWLGRRLLGWRGSPQAAAGRPSRA